MLGGGQHAWLDICLIILIFRVIGAVEGGMSRHAAARRFGVSVASAVRWVDAYRRTGRTAPKPRGGDRRSGRIEAQAELLMRAIAETPDITLAELRERLIAERGESFAISTAVCEESLRAIAPRARGQARPAGTRSLQPERERHQRLPTRARARSRASSPHRSPIEPTAGEVFIGGRDINKLDAAELRALRSSKIGMVFQNMALLPHRTVVGERRAAARAPQNGCQEAARRS